MTGIYVGIIARLVTNIRFNGIRRTEKNNTRISEENPKEEYEVQALCYRRSSRFVGLLQLRKRIDIGIRCLADLAMQLLRLLIADVLVEQSDCSDHYLQRMLGTT